MAAALCESIVHLTLSLHAEKAFIVAIVERQFYSGIRGLVKDNYAGGFLAHDVLRINPNPSTTL